MSFVLFMLLVGLGSLYWKKIKIILDMQETIEDKDIRLNNIKYELESLAGKDIGMSKDLLERFHEEKNYFGYIHGGMKDREVRTSEEFTEEMAEKYRY